MDRGRNSELMRSNCTQTVSSKNFCSKGTLISPESALTFWQGTKNFTAQFPPNTRDCAIQTSLDDPHDLHLRLDQCQQTSVESMRYEILSMLPEDFRELDQLLNLSEPKRPTYQRHSSCPGIYETQERVHITRSKSTEENTDRRSSSQSPVRKLSKNSFYSHHSLPDLSFLGSSATSSVCNDIESSLFDTIQIPIPMPVFVPPRPEPEIPQCTARQRDAKPGLGVSQNCRHDSCHVNHGCRQETRPCPSRSKTFPVRTLGHNLTRNFAESASSSSGFSTSSTSSGIDPGYCEPRHLHNGSPANDIERLLFYPPHVENTSSPAKCSHCRESRFETFPRQHHHAAASDNRQVRTMDRKFDRYAFEAHPGCVGMMGNVPKGKMTNRSSSSSPSTSGTSMHLENLYSLQEEQTPVPSPEKQQGCHGISDICLDPDGCLATDVITQYSEAFECNANYEFVDDDRNEIYLDAGYYQQLSHDSGSSSSSGHLPHVNKKPLKSCLRKKRVGIRSRSMSDCFSLNQALKDVQDNRKANRHSLACDEVYILADELGQLLMLQNENEADPVVFYLEKSDSNAEQEEQACALSEPEMDMTESGEKESSSKRKSVSFASEVSFHSISPQTSPKRKTNIPMSELPPEIQDHPLTQKLLGTASALPHPPPTCPRSDDEIDGSSGSDTAPSEFQVCASGLPQISESEFQRKKAFLADVSLAVESLVSHFAQSKDPFDKLRLGNTTDTPAVGELVLSRLCPAVARVIGDGLKPYLSGFQVFGRVHITIWRVAEASAELGPYTKAVHDLVKQLKDQPGPGSLKFDAFVFGLLNLRLLDFWMGYIRHKDTITNRFYEPDAILVLSKTHLQRQYEEMLISLQPLAVLPFQLGKEFVFAKVSSENMLRCIRSAEDVTMTTHGDCECRRSQSTDTLRKGYPERQNVSLTESAAKAWNWISSSTLPRTKNAEHDITAEVPDARPMPSDTCQRLLKGGNSCQIPTSVSDNTGRDQYVYDVNHPPPKPRRLDLSREQYEMDANQNVRCLPAENNATRADLQLDIDGSADFEISKPKTQTSPIKSLAEKFLRFGVKEKPSYKSSATKYVFNKDCKCGCDLEKHFSADRSESQDQSSCLGCKCDDVTRRRRIGQEETTLTSEPENRPSTLPMHHCLHATKESSSSGIIKLFDRLLLPGGVKQVKPRDRWSWTFGIKQEGSIDQPHRLQGHQISRSLSPVPSQVSRSRKLLAGNDRVISLDSGIEVMSSKEGSQVNQCEQSEVTYSDDQVESRLDTENVQYIEEDDRSLTDSPKPKNDSLPEYAISDRQTRAAFPASISLSKDETAAVSSAAWTETLDINSNSPAVETHLPADILEVSIGPEIQLPSPPSPPDSANCMQALETSPNETPLGQFNVPTYREVFAQ